MLLCALNDDLGRSHGFVFDLLGGIHFGLNGFLEVLCLRKPLLLENVGTVVGDTTEAGTVGLERTVSGTRRNSERRRVGIGGGLHKLSAQ